MCQKERVARVGAGLPVAGVATLGSGFGSGSGDAPPTSPAIANSLGVRQSPLTGSFNEQLQND